MSRWPPLPHKSLMCLINGLPWRNNILCGTRPDGECPCVACSDEACYSAVPGRHRMAVEHGRGQPHVGQCVGTLAMALKVRRRLRARPRQEGRPPLRMPSEFGARRVTGALMPMLLLAHPSHLPLHICVYFVASGLLFDLFFCVLLFF